MRQVVVVMPSAFTLGNLFFGFWAIVSAYNGNFRWAGWFIVFAGILDVLDGRIARLAEDRQPLRRGARLARRRHLVRRRAGADHVLPRVLNAAGSSRWVLCFIYVVAAAIRLARFNVVSAGKPLGVVHRPSLARRRR